MRPDHVNPAANVSIDVAPWVLRPEHHESSITRLIEQQTAKVPSHVFLSVSLLTMLASAYCEVRGNRHLGRFLGMWVAPLLIMGVYNKVVKTLGPA